MCAKKKKKSNKKNSKSLHSKLFNISIWVFVLITLYVLFFHTEDGYASTETVAERVEENYGKEIFRNAELYDISPVYFMALVMLESSGKSKIKPRFEPHVYQQLKDVRDGKRKRYETITTKMLTLVDDDALRNLASSWGPFQIMGYKCIQMGINIDDLRGSRSIYWGIKWIDSNYGDLLREHKYRDAFHYHNTGRKFPKIGKPKTYDPEYVTKGLKYMEYFKKNNNN